MNRGKDKRSGSAIVEFVLMAAFFLIPLVMGLLTLGFSLTRALQVAQFTRDVGRMYVRGLDFAEQANQDLITGSASRPNLPAMARGLGMQGNGATNVTGGTAGNGVVILSSLMKLPGSCNCTNGGHIVLTRRIVVGNKDVYASTFGAPAPGLINATSGNVGNTTSSYMSDASARADSFSGVVNLADNELAFLVETKFNFPDLAIPGVMSSPGVAWRAVF